MDATHVQRRYQEFVVSYPLSSRVNSSHTLPDGLTNAPDLLENAKKITCPVLFIRGDQEPNENCPTEDFAKNCPGPCEVAIIPKCDNFLCWGEDKVSKLVTEWLK